MTNGLERRAIIAAHATTNCPYCAESAMPRLTTRERAIVALWRTDMAEKSTEIEDKSRIGHAASDAWMTTANKAETTIERVRAVCDAVEYKDPGRPDTYGSYAEGRHDLASEILAALDEEERQ